MRTYAIFSDFFDIAAKRAIFVVMEEDLKTAVEVMRKGGVILYPTDTIWGIGCDATNAEAVDKVYKIKKRASNKAMLVLVGKMEDVENYVETVPEMAYQLNELSEKPITIIYDNALNLAQELLGDNSSVGIRVRARCLHSDCARCSASQSFLLPPISPASLRQHSSTRFPTK